MILSTKRKLLKAKLKLQETLQSILDINKRKKALAHAKVPQEQRQEIQSKLRLLNKVVEQQAKLVRLYETKLIRRKKRDTA